MCPEKKTHACPGKRVSQRVKYKTIETKKEDKNREKDRTMFSMPCVIAKKLFNTQKNYHNNKSSCRFGKLRGIAVKSLGVSRKMCPPTMDEQERTHRFQDNSLLENSRCGQWQSSPQQERQQNPQRKKAAFPDAANGISLQVRRIAFRARRDNPPPRSSPALAEPEKTNGSFSSALPIIAPIIAAQ